MLSVKHGYGPFHSTAFPDDISVNRTITKALVRTTEWFCIQYASIDFQLKTSFDFTMSVNFVQFIRFANVFWPLTKCHKESKYHSNKIVLSMRKKVAKEDSLGAKVDYLEL